MKTLPRWTERSGLWQFETASPEIRIVFTNRRGGVSETPYQSLNLGFHVGDLPERVLKNRELLCLELGLDPHDITSPRQRHTANVSVLEDAAGVGSGSSSEESEFDPCDGLLTRLTRTPLLLHFADCVPVVLSAVSTSGPVIAVLHAGRQGLFDGVLRNGTAAMSDYFGVPPESITAAVGPHIGVCCYEVEKEETGRFRERFGDEAVSGQYLDLAKAVDIDLTGTGLREENIYHLGICTCCDPDYYSYRRDGVTGRHGAIAWIEP